MVDIFEEVVMDNEQFVNWVSDFFFSDFFLVVSRDVCLFFYNYDLYWKRDVVYICLINFGNELFEYIGGIWMFEMVGVKIDLVLDLIFGVLLMYFNFRSKVGV